MCLRPKAMAKSSAARNVWRRMNCCCSASGNTTCRKKRLSGISICASLAACPMAVSVWALSARLPGSAAWNTCARRFRFPGCCTGYTRRSMMTTASSASLTPRKIRVIGVPLDLGQSRRGVDMGPSAVRVAGLEARLEALGHEVEDGGNVAVAIPEQKKEGDTHAKYLKEITATCTKHGELVIKTLEAGKIPLALGGDHSMAAGTVAGVAEFYRRQNQRIGLIWIDAHTDINTPETSPSGNVHGMPLAALVGLGPGELANIFDFSPKVKPENCVLVGVRDVDAIEKENVRRAGIGVFTMRDIDERGRRP